MPRFRRPLAVLAALGTALPLLLGSATSAQAAPAFVDGVRLNGHEASLVAQINAARRANGLVPVKVAPGATDVARRWSWQLAAAAKLSHNPSFPTQLQAAGSANWTWVTENVGYAPADDPTRLFQGYMNSPGHRANILDPKVHWIGIGSVDRPMTGGWLAAFNTMNFVDSYSTSYGPTRKPADGIALDARQLAAGAALGTFENGPDVRVETVRSGSGVTTSAPAFARPTTGDDAVSFTVRSVGTAAGSADLLLRDSVDLATTSALVLRLAQSNPARRALAIQVLATDSWGSTVTLATLSVPPARTTLRVPLPPTARVFRDALRLRVTKAALTSLSTTPTQQVATVALYSVVAGA